jgi:hypothetical protein
LENKIITPPQFRDNINIVEQDMALHRNRMEVVGYINGINTIMGILNKIIFMDCTDKERNNELYWSKVFKQR